MIKRRHALALMAVTMAVPTAAIAQKAAERMGAAELKHAEQTLSAGSAALETSKITQKKAQNAWVKKFANYEVAEQTTIAEVLKAAGAAPVKPSEKHASMIKKLEQKPSDAAFDTDYVAGQIEGHMELL